MYFKSEKGLLDSHTWRVVGEERVSGEEERQVEVSLWQLLHYCSPEDWGSGW